MLKGIYAFFRLIPTLYINEYPLAAQSEKNDVDDR